MEPPPVRWALIYTGQFEMTVVRLIAEDRIPAWVEFGWTVLGRDSDIWFEGLDDVYRAEQERGRR